MESKHFAKLTTFIGYGPSKPRAVFLGIEEAGGGADNIATRAAHFSSSEDLFNAHEVLKVRANFPSPFDSAGNPVQQWNTASIFHWLWQTPTSHIGHRFGVTVSVEENSKRF